MWTPLTRLTAPRLLSSSFRNAPPLTRASMAHVALANGSSRRTMALAHLPRTRYFQTSPASFYPPSAPRRGVTATRSNRSSHTNHKPNNPDDENLPLTQRLRRLIKKYGWYALGMYIIFSTIDFSVAFAGIYLLGAEHVSAIAATAKEKVASVLPDSVKEWLSRPAENTEMEGEGEEKRKRTGGREGFYTMLVLAYTVHKTIFLPFRVGMTAAFTPRVVRWLQRRGWIGREGAMRAAREVRSRMQQNRR